MSVKICHAVNFNKILEWEVDKFTGANEYLANEILRGLKRGLGNVSIIVQDTNLGIGDLVDEATGRFDGCLGMLQRNASDLLFSLNTYPSGASNLREGLLVTDAKMTIGCLYRKQTKDKGEAGQILDSFDALSIDVWSLCVIHILLVWLSHRFAEKMRQSYNRALGVAPIQRNHYHLYHTITHSLQFGELPSQGLFNKISYISCSLFALLVVHYFSSSIKTELVIVKNPRIVFTYDDIIKYKMRPVFVRGFKADETFRRAPPQSPHGKLWQYGRKNFGEKRMLFESGATGLILSSIPCLRGDTAIIMDNIMHPMIPATGCQLRGKEMTALVEAFRALTALITAPMTTTFYKENLTLLRDFIRREDLNTDAIVDDFYYHIATDPSERRISKSVVLNEAFKGPIFERVRRLFLIGTEIGINQYLMSKIKRCDLLAKSPQLMEHLGPSVREKADGVRDCMQTSTIFKDEVVFSPVTYENILTMLFVCFASYGLCLLLLLFQIVKKEKRSRGGRSRPRMRRRRTIG